MYFLGTTPDKNDQMGLAYSTDLLHWTEATKTPVLPRRPGPVRLASGRAGPSAHPDSDGIVLIYNGADDKLVYRTAVAIFDRKDPRKVLYRSDEPIFSPEKDWEKAGQVPNVVFVEGMVQQGNRFSSITAAPTSTSASQKPRSFARVRATRRTQLDRMQA